MIRRSSTPTLFPYATLFRSEHGVAAVLGRDVVDELLDEHGLPEAGAPEEAGLPALRVGREEVDDLEAGLEDLGLGHQLLEPGRSEERRVGKEWRYRWSPVQ